MASRHTRSPPIFYLSTSQYSHPRKKGRICFAGIIGTNRLTRTPRILNHVNCAIDNRPPVLIQNLPLCESRLEAADSGHLAFTVTPVSRSVDSSIHP